jgi:hypothetical protein
MNYGHHQLFLVQNFEKGISCLNVPIFSKKSPMLFNHHIWTPNLIWYHFYVI